MENREGKMESGGREGRCAGGAVGVRGADKNAVKIATLVFTVTHLTRATERFLVRPVFSSSRFRNGWPLCDVVQGFVPCVIEKEDGVRSPMGCFQQATHPAERECRIVLYVPKLGYSEIAFDTAGLET